MTSPCSVRHGSVPCTIACACCLMLAQDTVGSVEVCDRLVRSPQIGLSRCSGMDCQGRLRCRSVALTCWKKTTWDGSKPK